MHDRTDELKRLATEVLKLIRDYRAAAQTADRELIRAVEFRLQLLESLAQVALIEMGPRPTPEVPK